MAATIKPNNNTGLYNGLNSQPATANVDISTTGNIVAGGNVTGNNVNAVNLVSAGGNVVGANLVTNGTVSAAGNIYGGNLSVTGNIYGAINFDQGVTATGNITGGNLQTTGKVSATGNVIGNYFLGNIFYANGYSAYKIYNGNSEANIGVANGNANISINGVSNVVVVATTGEYVSGVVSATGNIIGNYFLGNIFYANGYSAYKIYNGNSEVNIPTANGNANISIGGTSNVAVFAPTGEYVSGVISATGNISGGNLRTVGQVSATGNVASDNYFIGNGSLLTGIQTAGSKIFNGSSNVTVISNSNVQVNVANNNITTFASTGQYTTGQISASGNVLGGNILTTGTISSTGTITSGANITGVNILTGGQISSAGNTTAANFVTSGIVSATGNVYGANFVGNIAPPNLSVLGNVTAGNLISNGQTITTGDVTGGNIKTGGLISATGNITGGNLTSLGSFNVNGNTVLTGNETVVGNIIVGPPFYTYGNFNSAGNGYIFVNGVQTEALYGIGANIVGNGPLGNIQVYANLEMRANTIYWVEDNYPPAFGTDYSGGIYIPSGNASFNLLTSNTSNANVATFQSLTVSNIASFLPGGVGLAGNVSINPGCVTPGAHSTQINGNLSVYYGNISTTGSITAASYNIGNANNVSALGYVTAGTYMSAVGNITGGNILTAGNITGGNITASSVINTGSMSITGDITSNGGINLDSANSFIDISFGPIYALNISAAGMVMAGNMQSSGNITGGNLKSTLNISAAGNVIAGVGYYFVGDGSKLTGITANAVLQGNLAGNINANTYYINNLPAISTAGNVTGAYILGNGSQLTGITANYSNSNVTSLMSNFGSNTISTTGNITTGNIIATNLGNVSALNLNGNASTVLYGNGVFAAVTGGSTYGNSNVTTLLAAFGSNTISTTGNITAGNLISTNLIISGSETDSGNITGGNLLTGGQVSAVGNITAGSGSLNTSNATAYVFDSGPTTIQIGTFNASTVRIGTSGSLTTLQGNVSAVGNVTAPYFFGNGSQLTGIVANTTYSNSNVTTLLASFGSNTISTTGNVSVGNLIVSGTETDTGNITGGNLLTGGQVSATGNITGGNIKTGGILSVTGAVTTGAINTNGSITIGGGNLIATGEYVKAGYVSVTGTVTANAVTYANTDGTAGQVLTTYGNGITYFSTVSGGGGSPGGSNTQIQYNNAGAFAGNGLMAFDNTTGNISLGNLVLNTNNIQTNALINVQSTTNSSLGNTTPWRITIGNGYNGSFSGAYDFNGQPYGLANPRLVVADLQTIGNQGTSMRMQSNYLWANLSANVSNTSTRINNTSLRTIIGGGANNYTFNNGSGTGVSGFATLIALGGGGGVAGTIYANIANNIGNIAVSSSGVIGIVNSLLVNPYSNTSLLGGVQTSLSLSDTGSAYGNATQLYGYYDVAGANMSNNAINGTSLYVGYYHPGSTTAFSSSASMGSIARGAGNATIGSQYYAFRNDDTLAKTRLGSLEQFNEYQYANTTATGNIVINKVNGQVQQYSLSGNINITGFSNFVTVVASPNTNIGNVYQTDTVTVILNQGTTGGYAITLPATGGNVKYAGGINTIAATTANTVTMLSITGYWNLADSQTEYLVTVSPAFA